MLKPIIDLDNPSNLNFIFTQSNHHQVLLQSHPFNLNSQLSTLSWPLIQPLILITISSIFILFSLFERHRLIKSSSSTHHLIHHSLSLTASLTLVLLSFALQLTFIILNEIQQHPTIHLLASISLLLAWIFAAHLHYLSHHHSRRSSSELLFFYLSLIFFSFTQPPFQHSSTTLITSLLSIRLILLLALFCLEYIGPIKPSSGSIFLPNSEHNTPISDEGECPILDANIFSRLTFGWITPLMRVGKRQCLTENDLWRLPRADQADSLSEQLATRWQAQLKTSKPSLIIAVARAYGLPYLVAAIFKLTQDILQFAQPQLLRRLLTFVDSYSTGATPEPISNGYLIAITMFVFSLVQTVLLHQYFQRVFVTGMRVRSGLIGLVYSKSLVLASAARGGRATGDIVNLMSTDVSKVQDCCSNGLIVFSGIFQLVLAFLSLYQMLGWPMFGGIAVILLSMPLNTTLVRLQTKLQKQQMVNKDRRTRLMSEILNNIRSIKLYTWESAFSKKMFQIRNNVELALLKKTGYLISASTTLWSL